MKTTLSVWLLFFVSFTASAQQKADTLFFESFNGSSLDRTKWNVEINNHTDNNKYLLLNLALGGGYPQSVNKVSLPYPGLPQITIDKIKAGQANFVVDWVSVTKN